MTVSADDIHKMAAKWLIELDAGGASEEHWKALEDWLTVSPRHRAAFLRLSKAWNDSSQLRHLRPVDGSIDPDLLLRGGTQLRSRRRSPRGRFTRFATVACGIAAASVLAVIVSLNWFEPWSRSDLLQTRVGGYEQFVTRDGSTITLNTDTRLRLQFTALVRRMTLLRGEALFTVSSTDARPFEVLAGSVTIRATGTVFNIRLRGPDQIEVLVHEGDVDVRRNSDDILLLHLSGGGAARIDKGKLHVEPLDASRLQARLSWRQGILTFSGETLAEVVREFNRYNTRKLVVDDPVARRFRVSGSVPARDPVSFALVLSANGIGPTTPIDRGDTAPIVLRRIDPP